MRDWWNGQTTSEGERRNWRIERAFLQSRTEEQVRTFSGTEEDIEWWLTLRNWSEAEFEEWSDGRFPAGLTYREPAQWHDGRFNGANQPVVGISWYEARAYAAWLSAQTGECYELPTEAEWEAAAREPGDAFQAYPYGENYELLGGNTFETRLLQTTPVGVFSAGYQQNFARPIADLSGNIWEWTISLWGTDVAEPDGRYRYPYQVGDEREGLDAAAEIRRVVRGGSWYVNQYSARAAVRYRGGAGGRHDGCGVRLVSRPPSKKDL